MKSKFKEGDKVKRIKEHDFNDLFNDHDKIFTVKYHLTGFGVALEEDPKEYTFDPSFFELVKDMKEKVTIGDTEYLIDINKAKDLGILETVFTPEVGGIYIHPKNNITPMICVKVLYNGCRSYQLLSYKGCRTYSNPFYHDLHTMEEIAKHLKECGMVFHSMVKPFSVD